MSKARAQSKQNLTHAHAHASLRGDTDAIPLLQKVLISSSFLRCRKFAGAMHRALLACAVVLCERAVNDVATRAARRGCTHR
jgi:hypothetical protein